MFNFPLPPTYDGQCSPDEAIGLGARLYVKPDGTLTAVPIAGSDTAGICIAEKPIGGHVVRFGLPQWTVAAS